MDRRFVVFLVAVIAGCGGDVRGERPVHRLVDPEHRSAMTTNAAPITAEKAPQGASSSNTAAFPRATILDDTRPTLYAPISIYMPVSLPPERSAQDRMDYRVRVGPEVPRQVRVVLDAWVVVDNVRTRLPRQVVAIDADGWIATTFQLPVSSGGEPLKGELAVIATLIGSESKLSTQAPPLSIPTDARLSFSYGILDAAWDQGEVGFIVDGCVESDCAVLWRASLDPQRSEHRPWQNAVLDLTAYAGRELVLRFRSTHSPQADDSFSLPMWADPTVLAPGASDERPNVILISLDTLRADRLGLYGYRYDTSPFLNETFGRGGTVFDWCVSAATSTGPSHMTMFSGLMPSEHGIKSGNERLPPAYDTLPELVRKAGVDTLAVTENGWLGVHHGFGRGFNVYRENKSANPMAPTGQIDVTLRSAEELLASRTERPFFLFIHTFQVHDPYAPPAPYAQLFERRPPIANLQTHPGHARESTDYDREIRYTDDELRRFWGRLDEMGLLQSTVILVTSDHGEAFLEHGTILHNSTVYDEVTRVPLLVAGPGVARSRRVTESVGHIDFANTISGLFGIDGGRLGTDGHDLSYAWQAEPAMPQSRSYVTESWAEYALGPDRQLVFFRPPALSVRSGILKMHRYATDGGNRYELYNIVVDPNERNNLLRRDPNAAPELRQALDRYVDDARVRNYARLKRLQATEAPGAVDVPIDPRAQEKLRALGYIE